MTLPIITYRPIGVIHSEHLVAEKTPIQPVFARECEGTVQVDPELEEGLRDLEGFSHIYLIYHLDRARPAHLTVRPFLQDVEHGVFSTRAPVRPNPIGMSIVELLGRDGHVLHIRGVDILDGTPLLDIKPYTERFDRVQAVRNGWYGEVDEETAEQRGRRGYHVR